MIDEKYEGHTEGEWEYNDATIHATAKGGKEIIAEYPCWNYNKDGLITKEEEANLRLMADAPLILAEYKKLREELSKVEEERDKYDGALNIALEHLGYQGADHDGFCKDKYECNVYGDDLEEEE